MVHPSFSDYMERCLYNDEVGYYGAGTVEFSGEPHFWTYPTMLSPIFGWAVAERIRDTLECWREAGLLGGPDRITILELGGGDGCLARDVLDYVVERSREPGWRPLAGRLEYVVGELSPALRSRQAQNLREHIDTGRARVVGCDARTLSWEAPFKGIVFCNELIDAFPVEKLRIASDRSVSRIHVRRVRAKGTGYCTEERLVSLSEGWFNESGGCEEVPADLVEYLRSLDPLISDLESCGSLPVHLCWPPSLPEFIARGNVLRASVFNDRRGSVRR